MPDFTKKYLTMDELVKWLVTLLYPREQFSVPRIKVVRDHVNRARSAGLLPERQKKGIISIEGTSFLRWISRKSVRGVGWGEKLKSKYPELYIGVVVVDVSGVSAEAEVGYVETGDPPKTVKKSNAALTKANVRIRELEKQVNEFEEKDKTANAYKNQQSKHGKSGGRGNTK
jgi:hypothetical protein